MPDKKHFVYSARTTEKGLALLNKTKGEMGWDQFINEAVAAHYGLGLFAITLPPSTYQVELEAKRKQQAEEKTRKDAEKAAEKKAADKKKVAVKKAVDKKAAGKTAQVEPAATEPVQEEAPADSQAED